MSASAHASLQGLYPGRLTLSAEEVALVLRHSNSRGVVQKVRERMQSGHYPDARKIDGRWHLPIAVVAEILDPTPESHGQVARISSGSTSRTIGRRRSQVGPRMRFLRDSQVWLNIFRVLGWEEAIELAKEREWERLELQDHFNSIRAARIKAFIIAQMNQ